MADRMIQRQKRCIINKSDFEKALGSLRTVCGMGEMPVEDLSGKHFSFVEPEEIMQAKTFEQALSAIRFAPVSDAEGNICELHFTGEKQGDEHIFGTFCEKRILPVVCAGGRNPYGMDV